MEMRDQGVIDSGDAGPISRIRMTELGKNLSCLAEVVAFVVAIARRDLEM